MWESRQSAMNDMHEMSKAIMANTSSLDKGAERISILTEAVKEGLKETSSSIGKVHGRIDDAINAGRS